MDNWITSGVPDDASGFPSWTEADEFFASQSNAWNAVNTEDLGRGARLVVERARAALNNARIVAQNHRNNGYGSNQGYQVVRTAFVAEGNPGNVALSGGVMSDDRFKDIVKTASLSAALFHVGLSRGLVSLADARDRDDIIGALWEIAPGLQDTALLAEALQKERDSSRQTVRRLVAEAQQKDRARIDEWESKLQQAYAAYVGWARRRSTRWASHTRQWEKRHSDAEQRIQNVETTFTEKMRLKAPVKYWKDKAQEHRTAEANARRWVLIFFPVALVVLAGSFLRTGTWLVVEATAPVAAGAPPFPTAVFIVASAGLASCAGLIFWVGRLLTKLYLSQHHLRQDADERATMTETYLALIESGAVSTDERQIILNALFRNTPDGIVKEDGGLDPSIAAALGKFLAKP